MTRKDSDRYSPWNHLPPLVVSLWLGLFLLIPSICVGLWLTHERRWQNGE